MLQFFPSGIWQTKTSLEHLYIKLIKTVLTQSIDRNWQDCKCTTCQTGAPAFKAVSLFALPIMTGKQEVFVGIVCRMWLIRHLAQDILAVLEPHIAVFVIVSRKQMEMCANILVTLSVKYGTMWSCLQFTPITWSRVTSTSLQTNNKLCIEKKFIIIKNINIWISQRIYKREIFYILWGVTKYCW